MAFQALLRIPPPLLFSLADGVLVPLDSFFCCPTPTFQFTIEVYAALRFRHATALEKGLAAFDASAYPEFFTRALWTVSGTHARCKQTFEIEGDCNYVTAFLAMALQATEGAIYLRLSGETKKLVRIHRAKVSSGTWMNLTDETGLHPFGYYVDTTEAVWAEASKVAPVIAAAKVTKVKAGRSKSTRAR